MKDNTRKQIEGFGRFFGAAAYGFVHAPVKVVDHYKIKHEKKRTLKNIHKLHDEYSERLKNWDLTKDEEDRLTKEFLEEVRKFKSMYEV